MNEIDEKLKEINKQCKNTLFETLNIEFTDIDDEKLVATMPVDKNTVQRFRILHGGASVALAESVASVAGWLRIDPKKQSVVGLEINANHLRSVKEGDGSVTATATPLKIGRKIHVWDIKIKNNKDKLVCISRCTLAVIDKIK